MCVNTNTRTRTSRRTKSGQGAAANRWARSVAVLVTRCTIMRADKFPLHYKAAMQPVHWGVLMARWAFCHQQQTRFSAAFQRANASMCVSVCSRCISVASEQPK